MLAHKVVGVVVCSKNKTCETLSQYNEVKTEVLSAQVRKFARK